VVPLATPSEVRRCRLDSETGRDVAPSSGVERGYVQRCLPAAWEKHLYSVKAAARPPHSIEGYSVQSIVAGTVQNMDSVRQKVGDRFD